MYHNLVPRSLVDEEIWVRNKCTSCAELRCSFFMMMMMMIIIQASLKL